MLHNSGATWLHAYATWLHAYATWLEACEWVKAQ